MHKLLIVEDHEALRQGIVEAFDRNGYSVSEAGDGQTAIRLINQECFAVVITDMSLPGPNGIEVLAEAKRTNPHTTVIVMTAHGTVENAVEAMRLGADDYLQKPFQLEELEVKVSKALHHQNLLNTVDELRSATEWSRHLVGTSLPIKRVIELVQKVAARPTTVLIQGETGTGKELVANAIHAASPRAQRTLVKVNCAALPESLLESELFGHERGAFTGADRQRIGRFELAHTGTLFLDEIAEISLATQTKLLRAVQEHAFERVGGEKTIQTDVRLIAATNKDLKTEVKEHRFREDLFYRLNVVTITMPSLRERRDDIAPIAAHFMERYTKELSRPDLKLDPQALEALEHYAWPGNIRELENTIERAVLLAEGKAIVPEDLNFAAPTATPGESTLQFPANGITLDEIEKQAILTALDMTNWVQKDAANVLSISPRVFNYKVKTHHITHPSWLRHKPPRIQAA